MAQKVAFLTRMLSVTVNDLPNAFNHSPTPPGDLSLPMSCASSSVSLCGCNCIINIQRQQQSMQQVYGVVVVTIPSLLLITIIWRRMN